MTRVHYLKTGLGQPNFPISESEYDELVNARQTLTNALAFEQRYDLLLANYIELELGGTEWSLRFKIESPTSTSSYATVIGQANRLIINLLTTSRSYVDQIVQDFKHLDLEPTFPKLAKICLEEAFDESHEYRFMEALRNHIQHQAPPVHGLGYSSSQDEGPNDWIHAAEAYALRSEFKQNKKFNKRALSEMEERVDLRRSARSYVCSLSSIHIVLRREVSRHVQEARDLVESTLRRCSVGHRVPPTSARALRLIDGKLEGSVLLILTWDDVRVELAKKNANPIVFGKPRAGMNPAEFDRSA